MTIDGKQSPTLTVIVTCCRYRLSLSVISSLAQAGYRVVTGDCIKFPLGRYSRYSAANFQYRDPVTDPQGFIEDIIEASQRFDAGFIVPTFTETPVVARHQARLKSNGVHSILSDPAMIDIANDKVEVTRMAERLGISVPRSWYPGSMDQLEQMAGNLIYPVIIKPRGGKAGQGQEIVNDPDHLIQTYRTCVTGLSDSSTALPFLQQYIEGQDIGVAYLYQNGIERARFSYEVNTTYQRVHSVVRTSTLNTEALAMGERLLSELKWHGMAQMDFILDRRSGKAYLLEINPRFWGSIQNALDAGVNFPRYLMDMSRGVLTESDTSSVTSQRAGIRTVWFLPYLLSLASYMTSGNFRELRKHFVNPLDRRNHFDGLSIRDPLPMLMEPLIGIVNLLMTRSMSLDKG